MTATDELLRLLDERGVEYRFNDATKVFEWHFDGTDGEGSAHATEVNGGVNIIACSLTPEQAIAATLGPDARHPKPHEQWTTVLLPVIAWGWDDRWPDYLSVAHDAHGEWRVYVPEDTLGSCNCSNSCTNSERTGTCRNVHEPPKDTTFWPCPHFKCSECGEVYVSMQYVFYCPHCGAKVVDD